MVNFKFNILLKNQKIKFVKNALWVWTFTQIILHVNLLFLSIPWSIFISNCFYIPLGYYFYGKNVFGLKKFNNNALKKFILLTITSWFLNTYATSLVHSFGINKNLSAFIVMPFLVCFSFLAQKYAVFKSLA